jgi:hypothetical protein
MLKVKINSYPNLYELENWINSEIKDKEVINIKFACSSDNDKKPLYSAMIMYDDKS